MIIIKSEYFPTEIIITLKHQLFQITCDKNINIKITLTHEVKTGRAQS